MYAKTDTQIGAGPKNFIPWIGFELKYYFTKTIRSLLEVILLLTTDYFTQTDTD